MSPSARGSEEGQNLVFNEVRGKSAKGTQSALSFSGRKRKIGIQSSLDKFAWRRHRLVECQGAGWQPEYRKFQEDAVHGRVEAKTLWQEERKKGSQRACCADTLHMLGNLEAVADSLSKRGSPCYLQSSSMCAVFGLPGICFISVFTHLTLFVLVPIQRHNWNPLPTSLCAVVLSNVC
jgi:hypothetical protein